VTAVLEISSMVYLTTVVAVWTKSAVTFLSSVIKILLSVLLAVTRILLTCLSVPAYSIYNLVTFELSSLVMLRMDSTVLSPMSGFLMIWSKIGCASWLLGVSPMTTGFLGSKTVI